MYNLDHIKIDGPNPPPWQIHYVNDESVGAAWYCGVLPEAHTHGLNKFNNIDLLIRKAPPNIAASVLDKIGMFLMKTNEKAKLGDKFIVLQCTYQVAPDFDVDKRPVFRLAWNKDPHTDDPHVLSKFKEACVLLNIDLS